MSEFLKRLRWAGFNVYVAGNMLVCSILFFGSAKPRETISGFIGRQIMTTDTKWIRDVLIFFARGIDSVFREPGHCGETAISEEHMRWELYPQQSVEVQHEQATKSAVDRNVQVG